MFKKILVLGIVFCLLAPNISLANNWQYDPYPFQFKQGKFYASLNAGAIFLNDISRDFSTATGGFTATADLDFDFDTGWSLGGTIGYIFSDLIRGEVNLGYAQVDYNELEITGTITNAAGASQTFAGSVNVKGEVSAVYGLTNIIFTPFSSKEVGGGKLTPLIGGGIGLTGWEDSIDKIDTTDINNTETGYNFTSNLIAGLEYVQNDNLMIGVRYRHVWIESGRDGIDSAEINSVYGTITHRF